MCYMIEVYSPFWDWFVTLALVFPKPREVVKKNQNYFLKYQGVIFIIIIIIIYRLERIIGQLCCMYSRM